MEERIQYLEDVKEIRELMHKFCYTMDAGEWDAVMGCYAKECSVNFGHFSNGEAKWKGRSKSETVADEKCDTWFMNRRPTC